MYIIKEKYFYASDCLAPVHAKLDNLVRNAHNAIAKHIPSWKNKNGGLKVKVKTKTNIWEEWMLQNPHMSSIGDIYDRCDNKTRTKIGKVVLETSVSGEEEVCI